MAVLEYLSLKPYNTFHVTACARFFTRLKTKEQLIDLVQNHFQYYNKILILGEGSNILLCNDFDGLAIKNEITGIEIEKEDTDHIWIRSLSGTSWHDLVMYCVGHE